MSIVKDTITIGKIVATVVILFNLNSFQEAELKQYVKFEQYEWIEKRKEDSEIESYIRSKANEITK